MNNIKHSFDATENACLCLEHAFLPVPPSLYRSDFFPNKGIHFTILTDDDVLFFCIRSETNGEGIESVGTKEKIGDYIRSRMGLLSERPITRSDLLRYGRTTIDFYKIDDENYFLDFSVK